MGQRSEPIRLVKAVLAAALTGAALLALMQYLVLPALPRKLTAAQIAWLRQTFETHTVWFLIAILAVAAILGLPVLLVALWAGRRGRAGRES